MKAGPDRFSCHRRDILCLHGSSLFGLLGEGERRIGGGREGERERDSG